MAIYSKVLVSDHIKIVNKAAVTGDILRIPPGYFITGMVLQLTGDDTTPSVLNLTTDSAYATTILTGNISIAQNSVVKVHGSSFTSSIYSSTSPWPIYVSRVTGLTNALSITLFLQGTFTSS